MYNFDKVVERRNTGSIKWDVKENELPMWIADMDFEIMPEIKEALMNKLNTNVYGYEKENDEFFNSYIRWWRVRHNVEINKDWFIFSSGVVASLSSIVRKLTTPGENVIVQTPVYNCFFTSIRNNGRNVLDNPLVYHNYKYSIDYDDLEKKLAIGNTTLMILCNPHNPVGHMFTYEELEKIGLLCKRHHVVLVVDEIHCDMVDPGYHYTSALSVKSILDNIVVCLAPSKTFNIAGLQGSVVVVPNENLRFKVWRGINTDEVGEPNAFVQTAHIAAYNYGDKWVDELNQYIYNNKEYITSEIEKYLPNLHIIKSHSLYLMWIDISYYSNDSLKFTQDLRKKTGLYVSSGHVYEGCGKNFIRVNLATTLNNVKSCAKRLKEFLNE